MRRHQWVSPRVVPRAESTIICGSVVPRTKALTPSQLDRYTAPEVIRGEHYGRPADVFSFGIVMCELLTLRAPYSDIMKDENGKQLLSWQQVVAMTHKDGVNLRPTLPEDMDSNTKQLITSCWSNDPARRPTFSVIIFRLNRLAPKSRSEIFTDAMAKGEADLAVFLRTIHDALWLFNSTDAKTDMLVRSLVSSNGEFSTQ